MILGDRNGLSSRDPNPKEDLVSTTKTQVNKIATVVVPVADQDGQIAFYVDNGPQLPLWRSFPHITYWMLPLVVAIPIVTWALLRHPLAQSSRAP